VFVVVADQVNVSRIVSPISFRLFRGNRAEGEEPAVGLYLCTDPAIHCGFSTSLHRKVASSKSPLPRSRLRDRRIRGVENSTSPRSNGRW